MTRHRSISELDQANLKTCERGCIRRDRHLEDCADDDCRGCEPRIAEHGKLCTPCHRRLDEMLRQAPGQCRMLRQFASMQAAAPARGDADLRHGTGEVPTPVRLACIDAIQEVGDALSELVEDVVSAHRMAGPKRRTSQFDRDAPGRLKRSYVKATREYIWTEPPARFEVATASAWLRAQIERLENLDGIGDTWEALASIMSQAHALAPWREEKSRLSGIPCPECHTTALAHFGGDVDVTCQRCRAQISPARYAIWVRMLAEKHAEGSA